MPKLSKETHPIVLKVTLGVGHPMGRKKSMEQRSFRKKTIEEAQRELFLLQKIGTVLSHSIK